VEKETSQDTGRPYIDDGNIRYFDQNTNEDEFVWHKDREDRYIVATHITDWQFQFDNKLPVSLYDNKLFIPKGVYHRLIKGTGDLTLIIERK
tara:strand:+ start:70 stop:345 length:276 start_codon:yes stop_codon:yes gene_type:complete